MPKGCYKLSFLSSSFGVLSPEPSRRTLFFGEITVEDTFADVGKALAVSPT